MKIKLISHLNEAKEYDRAMSFKITPVNVVVKDKNGDLKVEYSQAVKRVEIDVQDAMIILPK